MSSALNLSVIKSEVVKVEKKVVSWVFDYETLFMCVGVSSIPLTIAVNIYAQTIWGLLNG